jgi:serine/threonine protein kinase
MASGFSAFAGTPRFELLRPLGEGGMGVVYEAFDRERNSRVALKTIRLATADGLARFKNEFRALQDLQHPNLVRLDELLEAEGTWFFTMELVHGEDFISYVRARVHGADGKTQRGAAPLAAGSQPASPAEKRQAPGADDATSDTVASSPAGSTRSGPALPGTASLPAGGPREAIGFDEQRLRRALRQLVLALTAVHDARKVHRDVKPGNILVDTAGRVVLLDFGLITDAFDQEIDPQAVGTVSFMAPEQLAGELVGPAADWYAVGVTLYLALSGKRPFVGTGEQISELKQKVMPVPPGELVEHLPEDLDRLCMDLLARDPGKRPDGRAILARLGTPAATPRGTGPQPRRAGFVGRDAELDELRRAHARAQKGHAVSVLVHGESGMGKSALVKRFVDEVAGPDTVILNGRCYERESVPYKALDQVIDALARHLAGLPDPELEALLPDKIALVAEVFPTLRQVARIEELVARGAAERGTDPFQARIAVFAALRELWTRLGRKKQLIVTIDDLQWADVDSLALIAGLVRRPEAPDFLLCATVRTSVEASALGPRSLRSFVGDDVREIEVGRLPAEAAQRLAESLLGAAAGSGDGVRAGAVAAEAAGHPMFIEALVRHRLEHPETHGRVRLDEALVARSEALGAEAKRLLEFVCVAGGPVQQEVCAHAAGVAFGDFVSQVATLRSASLVKTHGARRGDAVEPYHDRVRESVVARLGDADRRELHARLGKALEDSGRADAEVLAHHFHEGGDPRRAGRYASRAAEQAQAAFAFERAARLYRLALALDAGTPAHQRRLELGLAEALACSGRGQEAAEVYLRAAGAADLPEAEQLELRWKAAEQLLIAGHIDAGVAEMRTVLRSIGIKMPETPGRAMVPLVVNRLRIMARGKHLGIKLRPAEDISAAQLARIDINWSMAVGLAIVDPIRGADFQTRHLLLALEAGEPYRLACALAAEAGFNAAEGVKKRERTRWLLDEGDKLASECGLVVSKAQQANAQGYLAFSRAIADYLVGLWRGGVELGDVAVRQLIERCVGVTWWIDSMQYLALECLWYLGDIDELCRRTRSLVENAQARGDLYAATNLQIGIPSSIWLVADDPASARQHIDEVMSRWSATGFHIQHEGRMHGEVNVHLYGGDGEAARAQLMGTWKTLSKSPIFTVQLARVAGYHTRARTALALAGARPDARAALVKDARWAAKQLVKEGVAWAEALAALARAGAAMLLGDQAGAAAELEVALAGFEALEMKLYAAVVRMRQGQLRGGTEGAALQARAEAWMRGQGIVRPERFAAMLAPGF